jgi:protein-S-isoprenylcysteine O-methyltransferase Ste14
MNNERLIAKSTMIVATLIGSLSMLLFLVFLFSGSFALIKMGLPETAVLVWNSILSFVFFIQHSGMIRRNFRTRLAAIIPSYFNDAIFTITSSIALIAVIVFWQPSTTVLFEFNGFARWIARGFFFLAVAGMGWGVYALKYFDAFGRIPIRDHLNGKQHRSQKFTVYGPYLWVRHPLYFFVLLLIWSCPDLTLDRFIFNFLWTIWIFIGAVLEEKDLLSDFGDDYRQYQSRVPMLIPWKGRCNNFNSTWRFNHGS